MSGIYKISFNGNNKRDCYIGQAQDFTARMYNHRHHLRRGTHFAPKLQRAYDENGHENMRVEILELCEVEVLTQREQHYLDTIKPRYNPTLIASEPPMRGKAHSDDAKQRISDAVRKFSHKQELAIVSSHIGLGFSTTTIALQFGCSEPTIRTILRKHGIDTGASRRPKGRAKKAGRKVKFDAAQEQAIARSYQSGKSTAEVAQEFGCSQPTVVKMLDKLGIERRRGQFNETEQQDIVRQYKNGKTTEDIAAQYGCNHSTIGDELRRAGVELRGRGRKRLLTDKQERQALALRDKGRSVSEVAAKFGCSPQAMRNILNKHRESA
ncbi:endonuclease [Burkholderia phage BcepSauron]|uniref:Endonuclease n=2 Tax=Sarumanvirus TaxID=2843450 RepID=A0A482MMZ3_9CAUD|nr:GIY-YIG homing endonuclease [Burkholderia phage BcepSaruman]YP_009904448.1 endonuclease [Burkholderia phage BcepSauron]QBQ74450.1 endonuclease [Burkholderia phage BcepSauron]QBX06483.1 GIY-YIG homing endonuclease [Burkholderia phage BcepSaruman]